MQLVLLFSFMQQRSAGAGLGQGRAAQEQGQGRAGQGRARAAQRRSRALHIPATGAKAEAGCPSRPQAAEIAAARLPLVAAVKAADDCHGS